MGIEEGTCWDEHWVLYGNQFDNKFHIKKKTYIYTYIYIYIYIYIYANLFSLPKYSLKLTNQEMRMSGLIFTVMKVITRGTKIKNEIDKLEVGKQVDMVQCSKKCS